jgi:hypothetical protein
MPHATTLHHALRGGSSLPLVVEADNGRWYVAKLRASGDGAVALAAEWLALSIGHALGLPIAQPHIIDVDTRILSDTTDPEIRDLVQHSVGANLATEYVRGAAAPSVETLAALAPSTREDLFLYDVLVLNVDRNDSNPNAVMASSGPVCLDFGAAMAVRNLLVGRKADEIAYLTLIRDNPLYSETANPSRLLADLESISGTDLDIMVNAIPDAWLQSTPWSGAARKGLRAALAAALLNATTLHDRLATLRTLTPIPFAERIATARENLETFQKKFGPM